MGTRFISTTISLAIIFAAIAVLLFAYSIPASSVAATNSTSSARDILAERAMVQTEVDILDASATGSAVPRAASLPDGPSLLASHCTKCHTAQSLRQIEKQRADWELTLAQMERMGVHLSDSEKFVLLDYLAVTDSEP